MTKQSENYDQKIDFVGIISEIPGISVDYFLAKANAYFLSHCHTDHMKGLWPMNFGGENVDASIFQDHVENSTEYIPIYCSEISANFLQHEEKFTFFRNLQPLCINQPTSIWIPSSIPDQKCEILVTLIPTGHCPGAVMFLFEGTFGNVLYTGDFRIAVGDTAKFQCLKTKLGPKHIANLYLDTTFCTLAAQHFPARTDAVAEIIRLAREWVSMSPDHHVYLNTAGQFGAEFLFGEVAEKLQCKIHVSEDKHRKYFCIEGLRSGVTLDGSSTQVHHCVQRRVNPDKGLTFLSCQERNVPVRAITATTQAHLNRKIKEISYQTGVNRYQVFYSMHASLEEIQDMVAFLKPEKITPIAAFRDITLQDIATLLKRPVELPKSLGKFSPSRNSAELLASSKEFQEETQLTQASKRVKLTRHLSLYDYSPSLGFLNGFTSSVTPFGDRTDKVDEDWEVITPHMTSTQMFAEVVKVVAENRESTNAKNVENMPPRVRNEKPLENTPESAFLLRKTNSSRTFRQVVPSVAKNYDKTNRTIESRMSTGARNEKLLGGVLEMTCLSSKTTSRNALTQFSSQVIAVTDEINNSNAVLNMSPSSSNDKLVDSMFESICTTSTHSLLQVLPGTADDYEKSNINTGTSMHFQVSSNATFTNNLAQTSSLVVSEPVESYKSANDNCVKSLPSSDSNEKLGENRLESAYFPSVNTFLQVSPEVTPKTVEKFQNACGNLINLTYNGRQENLDENSPELGCFFPINTSTQILAKVIPETVDVNESFDRNCVSCLVSRGKNDNFAQNSQETQATSTLHKKSSNKRSKEIMCDDLKTNLNVTREPIDGESCHYNQGSQKQPTFLKNCHDNSEKSHEITIVPETQIELQISTQKIINCVDLTQSAEKNITVVPETPDFLEIELRNHEEHFHSPKSEANVLVIPETEESVSDNDFSAKKQSQDSDVTFYSSSQDSVKIVYETESPLDGQVKITNQIFSRGVIRETIDTSRENHEDKSTSSQSMLNPFPCDPCVTIESESGESDSDATCWSDEKDKSPLPEFDNHDV